MEKNTIKALLVFTLLLLGVIVALMEEERCQPMMTKSTVHSSLVLEVCLVVWGLWFCRCHCRYRLDWVYRFLVTSLFSLPPKDNANAAVTDTPEGGNKGANIGYP